VASGQSIVDAEVRELVRRRGIDRWPSRTSPRPPGPRL